MADASKSSPDEWLDVLNTAIPGFTKTASAPNLPRIFGKPEAQHGAPYSLVDVLTAIALRLGTDESLDRLQSSRDPASALHRFNSENLQQLYEITQLRHPHLVLLALMNWRTTKGIYRFDPATAAALMDTRVDTIDAGAIAHLPEWAPYIDLRNVPLPAHGERGPPMGLLIHSLPSAVSTAVGAAHGLEASDAREARLRASVGDRSAPCLIACLDYAQVIVPVILPLLHGMTLHDALIQHRDESRTLVETIGVDDPTLYDAPEDIERVLHLLSLPLYLTTPEPDVSGRWPPSPPAKSKVRPGQWRSPSEPRVWDVGQRIGAALRGYGPAQGQAEAVPTGHRMAPHIRRAHWHGYWTGPRNQPHARRMIVKWIPPVAVNVGGYDALPATVRSVES